MSIVMLKFSDRTQKDLQAYSGKNMDYHITLVSSTLSLPAQVIDIAPLNVCPSRVTTIENDDKTQSYPCLDIETNPIIRKLRNYYIREVGLKPIYKHFRPHVSLSYKNRKPLRQGNHIGIHTPCPIFLGT